MTSSDDREDRAQVEREAAAADRRHEAAERFRYGSVTSSMKPTTARRARVVGHPRDPAEQDPDEDQDRCRRGTARRRSRRSCRGRAPGGAATHRVRIRSSEALDRVRERVARTPLRSSAASPASVLPPGEATARADVVGSCLAGARPSRPARPRPARRRARGRGPPRAPASASASATAPCRRASTPSPPSRRRSVAPRRARASPSSSEEARAARPRAVVGIASRRRVADHAPADLDRLVRHQPDHGDAGEAPRASRRAASPPSTESDRPWRLAAELLRDRVERGRLHRQDDRTSQSARELRSSRWRVSPPTSSASAAARAGVGVAEQHRLGPVRPRGPAARHRRGHVARAGEPDPHRDRRSLGARAARTG